ncbi:MAG: RNA polymerase sigma-70 factor [Aureispira sp.]|nr:RNA polymerase sigma-70 factor [Aureispira sp.]
MTQNEFKSYFDQYFDAIRNYIYYRSGDGELATDIAQDTFMKVWEKRMQLSKTSIKSLLYKIANDLFISQIRKNKVKDQYLNTMVFDFKTDSPEVQLRYKELKQHYEKTLAQVPENQRTVFLMSRMEGLTYSEIATRLNISNKAVEKRMSKVLSTLRAALKLVFLFITTLNFYQF